MGREEQVQEIRMKMERYLDTSARDKDFYSLYNNHLENREKFKHERERLRGFAEDLEQHYLKEYIEEAERQVENNSRLLYGLKLMGPNFSGEKLEELIQDTNKYGTPRAKKELQEIKSRYEKCGLKEKFEWEIKASRYFENPLEHSSFKGSMEVDYVHDKVFGYNGLSGVREMGILNYRKDAYPDDVHPDYVAMYEEPAKIAKWDYEGYFSPRKVRKEDDLHRFEREELPKVEEKAIEYYCKKYDKRLADETYGMIAIKENENYRGKPIEQARSEITKRAKEESKKEIAQWKAERMEAKDLWAELREKGRDFSPEKMKRLAELERHPFGGDGIVELGRLNYEYRIIVQHDDKIFPEYARVRKEIREKEVKEAVAKVRDAAKKDHEVLIGKPGSGLIWKMPPGEYERLFGKGETKDKMNKDTGRPLNEWQKRANAGRARGGNASQERKAPEAGRGR
ncbi:MAG: hypothetical protein PHX01_06375 [Clostridia bacterium]|nr:hypothetical protein [Clostridia bacterium]